MDGPKVNLSKASLELVKLLSDKVWGKYDDTHGYRTDKQAKNVSVSTDIPDNIWFFWGQFDQFNQAELMRYIKGSIDENTEGAEELYNFLDKQCPECGYWDSHNNSCVKVE